MSISIHANSVAMGKNLTNPLSASGGVGSYTWSVKSGGIDGTIGASTGIYTSPDAFGVDTVQVKDSAGSVAYIKMNVLNPLQMVCDIIQNEMGLPKEQVFLYNQKYNIPNDSKIYIAVGVVSMKPFGNSRPVASSGDDLDITQSLNVQATLNIDIMSRSIDALNRKEEVLMALNSQYSESQQEFNSFYIARLPTSFVSLNEMDGAAIPYRFNTMVNIQYMVSKTKAVSFFDDFEDVEIATDPSHET